MLNSCGSSIPRGSIFPFKVTHKDLEEAECIKEILINNYSSLIENNKSTHDAIILSRYTITIIETIKNVDEKQVLKRFLKKRVISIYMYNKNCIKFTYKRFYKGGVWWNENILLYNESGLDNCCKDLYNKPNSKVKNISENWVLFTVKEHIGAPS